MMENGVGTRLKELMMDETLLFGGKRKGMRISSKGMTERVEWILVDWGWVDWIRNLGIRLSHLDPSARKASKGTTKLDLPRSSR